MPVAVPTVTTPVLLLLHVPAVTASLKADVIPPQSTATPVIADGDMFMVIIFETVQPSVGVYCIIAVPVELPATSNPVPAPILATVAGKTRHVPPVVASANVVVVPPQRTLSPVTGDVAGYTVIPFVAGQTPTRYCMVTGPEELLVVTTPVLLPIMAMAVLLLLQCPPVVASVMVVVAPAHSAAAPAIATGFAFTVNVCFAEQPVVFNA